MITLPVQVAPGFPLKIRGNGDASGGWSTIEFDNMEEVRAFMAANPRAEMPCWRRFGGA
jgi:hypothetical protein